MKIIGSLVSPFVRFTRVMCEELDLAYELVEVPSFAKMKPEHLAFVNAHNPLLKVPVLMDTEAEIVDSRVIANFLLTKQKTNTGFRTNFPASWKEENILTVILGVADAGILRFVLPAGNPEINPDSGYMERSLNRIKSGLEWLDKQPLLGRSFGVPEAALICVLDWFTKRKIYEWNGLPNIVKTYQSYWDRPSLTKTRIPESV